MRGPQLKALFVTTLIVGGLIYYFVFGVPSLNRDFFKFEKPAFIEKLFSKSENKKSTKSNRLKSSGGTGRVIDSYNGVDIYYNGSVRNVSGRNVTKDGYNLGLKYQCVEFVKRFYYEFYSHKMPDSYGHARDFYDGGLSDGAFNRKRGLYQYRNGSSSKPKRNDILVFGPAPFNEFGHVAIISSVNRNSIQIVQQNPGALNPSREELNLSQTNGKWFVNKNYVKAWLRK